MRVLSLIASACLLLCGCATADFTPSDSGATFAPYSGEVAVLPQMPATGTFERVGVVVGKGGLAHGRDELTRAMKERARRMGANAIVIVRDREYKPGAELAMQPVMEMSAVAIFTK